MLQMQIMLITLKYTWIFEFSILKYALLLKIIILKVLLFSNYWSKQLSFQKVLIKLKS